MISFVFAMDKHKVIGKDNWMPWDLPRDLQFFKKLTMHHTIIMGRKTFESFKRPLPNRRNVIITRDQSYDQPECVILHSIEPVLAWNREDPDQEYFVIGGGEIFKHFLPYADRMYMTYIDALFEGDTYFPEYDQDQWKLTKKERGIEDEQHSYAYYFLQYDRIH